MRAGLALLLALVTAVVVTPGAERADAAVVRSFSKLFSQQTNGSIAITGNRLMTCGNANACTEALAGTTTASNNNFTMTFLDADNVSSTSSSSGAGVSIPSGARVLYAGLFWGAARTAGQNGNAATGNPNQLKFRAPGAAAYTTLTADTVDSSGLSTNDYSAYKDVTSIVQAAGSGTYWGADISAATGSDRYGAWSLVVAIGDPTAPLRDLTVFNGYATLTNNELVTTTISGFLAPPSGAVSAKFGTVVYEGDAGLTGDYMTVGTTRLADAQSPSANFFGSRVTAGGANLTDRTPASVNNLGADSKVVDAPGVVPNGATSTNVTFSTSGDFYYPAVLTTQIDLYAPTITGTKSASNLSGNSPARAGDVIEYTMAFTNTGDDNAVNSVVEDALPPNSTYVPGSLSVLAGAGTGAKTDAAGDDQAEYVAATRQVRFRVGTGANATSGGVLSNGGTTRLRFQVTVDTAASGTTLSNSGNLVYTAATIGTRYTYQTADASTPVATRADLSLTKTTAQTAVVAGNTVTYTLRAANSGPTAATDVVVTDTLPSGATLVSSTPSQGACTPSGQTLTCAVGTVPNGAAATVTVVVRVPSGSTATTVTNVADVSSSTSDPDTTNNRASVTTPVTRAADVSLTKTVSTATPAPGTTVTYTLTARNNGLSDAVDAVVTDTLPTAFQALTATTTAGSCTVTGNGISCAVGTLAPGATATVQVTARVDSGFSGGGALVNRAQVQSSTPDPTPANNTAAVTVTPTAAVTDIQVAKETLTSPVVAGGPVAYRVTLTNAGPSVARTVTLTDALPSTFSGVTATTSLGTCTVAGTTVSCTVDPLPTGSSVVVTVNAVLSPTATGTVANTASATSATTDPTPGNNAATVTDTVTTAADLDLDKGATPVPVVNGQDVTYTLRVRNLGPSTSRGVVLTDPVPAPLVFRSAAPSQGSCTQSGGTVTCLLGDVPLGATATVTVVAAVPPAGGANGVTNTARVTASTTDPATVNNTASYRLSTGASANVVMSKTAGPATATAGAPVTFTLTARNAGPSDAQGVTVTDQVPASVAISAVTTTTPGATCTTTGNAVSCTASTLTAGSSLVVTVQGTLAATTAAGTLTNTATATVSSPTDPTLGDNTATTSTPVQTRADVVLAKTGPATVTAGGAVTWTLTARNDGPSTARDVLVQDAPPRGFTFATGTGPGTTCEQQQDIAVPIIECALGTLAPGESRTITLSGSIDADTVAGTALTNSATMSSSTPDPNPANNTAAATTTTTTSADVSVSKSVAPDPLTAGAAATYTLLLGNAGPSTAQGVTVTDTLPAALRVTGAVVAGGTCAVAGQQVTCTVPQLAAGATAEALVQVVVAADTTAAVTNTASVSSSTPDPTPGDNTDALVTPVEESADLELLKTADTRSVVAGTGLTYTVTVVNNGPSVATAATVTDTLPTGLTYLDGSTSAGACTVSGQTVTCAVGDVAPGDPVTITISARLARGFAADTLANSATVASPTPDPASDNDTATADVEVTRSADLSVSKAATPETVVPGREVTYAITVTNDGPSTARDVTVADAVPAGIRVTSATWGAGTACTVAGQDVTCALGSVPVGQVSVTVVGTVDSQFAGTSLTNTATVASGTDDPDPDGDTATVVSPVVGQADLELVKTITPTNPVAGQQVTFTLTATNNGPSAALSPQFIDQLPPGLTNVSVVPPPGAAGCEIVPPVNPGTVDNPAAPTVICSGPVFRAGITVVGTITATITPAYVGTLSNTGRTSSDTLDPVASNNESTVAVTVGQSADLSIVKTASPATPVPGQPVTYSLAVRNAGPSTATAVAVSDVVPATMTGVRATSTAGTCTVGAGNAVSCALGSVAPSALVTVTVAGTLSPSATGAVTNTATVTASTPDPDTTDNSSTVTSSTAPSADVSVTKTLTPAAPVPGGPVTFTMTVRNAGPSTATAVTLTDPLDDALRGTAVTSSVGTCTVTGTSLGCRLGDLAPGGSATVTVTAVLDAGLTGSLSNTATVGSATADPVPGNDTATASGTTAPSADVSVTKTLTPEAPIPGAAVSYTVQVRNAGPSTASGVVVTDPLDAAITQVTATVDDGSTCALAADNTLSCPVGSVAPGGQVTVSVTGTLAPDFTGRLENTATARSATPDPVPDNNTASASGQAAPSADVSIGKALTPLDPTPGEQVRFTLTVDDVGPSTAAGVTVRDQLDPALGDIRVTSTAGTCTVDAARLLTCALGALDPDDTEVTVTVIATLSTGFTGTLTNTATATSSTPDPDTSNNSATVSDDSVPSADLSVVKTIAPLSPVPGQPVTFTLVVANAGPSNATQVTLTDRLDAALEGATATTSAGTCAVGADDALTCGLGTVISGATVTVTVTATLQPGYTGPLSNTARVASPVNDPQPGNNTSAVTGPTLAAADLSVSKSVSPGAPVPGRPVTYTVTVRNAGPSTATEVVLTDPLDPALTGATATSTAGSCSTAGGDVTCALGAVAPSGVVTVTVTADLDRAFTGTLTNTATVRTATVDPDRTNDSDTVSVVTAPSAGLSISKTLEPAAPVPGAPVTYTLTVTNDGPSTATGVLVIDQLDTALTAVTATADDQSPCTVSATDLLTCPLAPVAPGERVTVTVTATLDPGFTGALVNDATVSSDTPDPDPSDDTASVTGTASPSADVSVVKTLTPSVPVPGQPVTYTFVVTNDGPSTATGVELDDPLDAALTGALATSDLGSCSVEAGALDCDLGSLAPGSDATVTLTAVLSPSFTGTLTNTATVSAQTSDPDPANATSTANGAAAPSANLSLTKAVSPERPVPGQPVTFTLGVRNDGPSDATGVTVEDTLADVLSNAAATSPDGTCDVTDGGVVTCDLGTLAPGAVTSVTIRADLASSATGILENTATVGSDTDDPDTDDNTATVTGTTAPAADLSVTKTLAPTDPVPGQRVTFTLTVRDNGPSDAVGVTVVDDLDPALTDVRATSTAGTCAVAGSSVACALGTLAAGADPVVVTVEAMLSPDFDGQLTNTAVVAADTVDPNPANNTATATAGSAASADVSVTKAVSPAAPVPGAAVTFTVTARNAGPSTAAGVVVADVLDPRLADVTATADDGTACRPDGSSLSCPVGALPVGGVVTVTVTATLAPDAVGQLTNTATADSPTTDPDTSNNSDTVTASLAPSADLGLTKTLSPAAPVPGGQVEYTLVVTNAGPSTATAPVVSDQLSPALTAVATTTTQGVCSVDDGNRLTCEPGDLAPGGSVTVTVSATLSPDFTGTLSNRASVDSVTPDPDPTNNLDEVDGASSASADLSIVKTSDPATPVPGGPVTYLLEVTNDGPSTATSVTVTDELDDALLGVGVVTSAGGCTQSATGALSCDLGSLAPGESATVTVTATVDAGRTGSLANTAVVTSATPDPDPTNNTDTVDPVLSPVADLKVTKVLTSGPPVPGTPVTYSLTVDNLGPSTATGVTLTDVLDPRFSAATATPSAGTCDVVGATVECDLRSLAPDDPTVTVTLTALLAPDALGVLTNTATVGSDTTDPVTSNDTTTVTSTVEPSADVSVEKEVLPTVPVPGEEVTFTVTVSNAGPSSARDVVVRDVLPADVTLTSDPSTTVGACTVVDGALECDLGTLAPTVSTDRPDGVPAVVVTVVGTLDPETTAPVTNTATVGSSTPDPDTANNTDTATGDPAPSADLTIVKTFTSPTSVPGQRVGFTITVTNDGPSTATQVRVDDRLDPVLSDPEASTGDPSRPCTTTDDAFSCDLGSLAPDDSVTITGSALLAPDHVGELVNVATVESATFDPDTSDNTATATATSVPAADVSVTKTVEPTRPTPGAPVTFNITVDNDGPSTATGRVVTDQLADALLRPEVTSTAGTCTVTDGLVRCELGDLAPADPPVTITVRALLDPAFTGDPAFSGRLVNTAEVTAGPQDPDPSNNTDTVDVVTGASADLSVTKVVTSGPVVAGRPVTWAVTVRNDGPSSSTGTTLTDSLPEGVGRPTVTVMGADPGAEGCDWSATDRQVRCELGTIASGATAVVTLTALVDPAASGTLTNTATVTGAVPDPASANGTDSVTSVVTGSSDVSVVKTVSSATARVGDRLTYTLTVMAAGPSTARGVTLRDVLPDGLALVGRATTDAGRCTTGDATVTCALGDLQPGSTVAVTLAARVVDAAAGRTVTNTASVTSSTPDPGLGNDRGSATVSVAAATPPSPGHPQPPPPVHPPVPPVHPPTPGGPDLPITGEDVGLAVGLGVGAVLTGLLLLHLARRREDAG
ncbi:DUF7507 domain-containing protein [Terracoccus luteus]|uniref:Putative repeat protein (TIGR01451 family) n=1 Tax=Terracoccus luteus TaxID=53356 RepID=A0A839Q560_9MICO|nr:DUF11 domain-containing protein [Terracoccus luteus]MBB2987761.1 putative repeat protein (TIGR01451 family) [Terracoccus luteus]MCP2173412.1 putative repeat protein (TIGR01451 family) [Terracoccus luteus]